MIKFKKIFAAFESVLQIKNATVVRQLHFLNGGAGRSRTDLHGFAIRCITALLPRHFLRQKREAVASLNC
mgnify:CR=1 FL=1